MKERILGYRNRIDELLKKNDETTDWTKVLEEHLVQIGFFQHERFVHLLVTVTFALMELISMGIFLCTENMTVILLCIAIFVLLIPYIVHYYLLENETQKMYTQYDKILENINLMKKDN